VDDAPLPPKLADLLDPAARRAGIEAGAKVGIVWSKWLSIVGREVAGHAEPTSLRDGVLRVRADSPAWAGELHYFGAEIRARANEAIGAPVVKEVRVWTGPGPIRSPGQRPRDPDARIAARDSEGAREVDPRAALGRAYRVWRNRVRSGMNRRESRLGEGRRRDLG
jgi:predicted nucleic acid-binding Zn ribbon protein